MLKSLGAEQPDGAVSGQEQDPPDREPLGAAEPQDSQHPGQQVGCQISLIVFIRPGICPFFYIRPDARYPAGFSNTDIRKFIQPKTLCSCSNITCLTNIEI